MSKQYSTRILTKADEPKVEAVMKRHPHWTKRHARDCVARNKFQERIDKAGKRVPYKIEEETIECISEMHRDRLCIDICKAIKRATNGEYE